MMNLFGGKIKPEVPGHYCIFFYTYKNFVLAGKSVQVDHHY